LLASVLVGLPTGSFFFNGRTLRSTWYSVGHIIK
uniref:Chloride channel protein n=1 Tax=Haemonchus placei TaxID=6290 RepID=A0A0N4WGW8_HAEPC